METNYTNRIEKSNGNKSYNIVVVQHVYDSEIKTIYGMRKYTYSVVYSWKNEKRSMNNLSINAPSYDEALRIMHKKAEELEKKIK